MTIVDRRYSVAEGTAIKAPCRVATTANIALSGLQTIDGITLADGDRVLVKDQTNAVDNGIYSASSGNWTRTRDFDGAYDVVTGTAVYITSGTAGALHTFLVTTTGTITPGSTSIAFQQDQISAAVASAAAAASSASAAATSATAASTSASAASSSATSAATSAATVAAQIPITRTAWIAATIRTAPGW